MPNRKIMALPVILLVSLSFTGYALANWTSSVVINGAAYTAKLDVAFSYTSPVDEMGTDPYSVATTSVVPSGIISDTVHTITMTINNAYPGYEARISISIANIGNVPAKLVGFSLNGGAPSYSAGWSASLPGGEIIFGGHDGLGEIIDVGDYHTYQFDVQLTAASIPDQHYEFTVGIVFVQGV